MLRLTIDAKLQSAAEQAIVYGIHTSGQWAADGGAICNGGQGPCYTTGTGLGTTMPGSQRQIQFALKVSF